MNALKDESLDEQRRIHSAIINTIKVGDNILQQFKICTSSVRGFHSYVGDLMREGKLEAAFYRYFNLLGVKICGMSGCTAVHPLLISIELDDHKLVKFLMPYTSGVLLKRCKCVTDNKIIHLLSRIISLNNIESFKTVYPELAIYADDALKIYLQYLSKRNEENNSLRAIVLKYYGSKSTEDRQAVIDKLSQIHNPLTESDIEGFMNLYLTKESSMFVDLIPYMSPAQRDSFVAYEGIVDYSELFKSFMTQRQKNAKLWSCSACTDRGMGINIVKAVINFGGDIYSPDPKGNPWIVCLLAGSCWRYVQEDRMDNNPDAGLDFYTLPYEDPDELRQSYILAKQQDGWHIATHCKRSFRFRDLTMNLLLCIRRVRGCSLPKPVIVQIMEYITYNNRPTLISDIESDELERADVLTLMGLFLYIYDKNVNILAISRNIKVTTDNIYVNAELLAKRTRDHIFRSGRTLQSEIVDLRRAAQALYETDEDDALVEQLKTVGLKHRDPDWRGLDPGEVLAFHYRFGFGNVQNIDEEPREKRQKL